MGLNASTEQTGSTETKKMAINRFGENTRRIRSTQLLQGKSFLI